MLPIRWDPLRDISRGLGSLHREIDDIFRRTFGEAAEPGWEGEAKLMPNINTYQKEKTFHVQAELPGVKKEDLDLSIEGNVLTIRGERKLSKEIKEQDYLLRESRFGTFQRRMTLPEGVNSEEVHASFNDGILDISMPLKKAVGGKKITIEAGKKEVH